MILIFILFALLLLIPLPIIQKSGGYHSDYIMPSETLAIKGFCVALVFFRHSKSYIDLTGNVLDRAFLLVDGIIGQLLVVMFFFYSGYGIYESIKRKGKTYIDSIPRKRFLTTWISFAICVAIYFIYNVIVGKVYSTTDILLSFIGWSSIGNSNWYMFVTFILYILVFLSFISQKDSQSNKPLTLFTICSLVVVIVLYYCKPWHWCNTLLCYPAGMWFSKYKERIMDYLQDENYGLKRYCRTLMTISILFFVSLAGNKLISGLFFIPEALLFASIIVMLSMKIKLRNPFLIYLGNHVFSIYMFQRLSFLVLQGFVTNRYLLYFTSFILTLGLSSIFEKIRTNQK